MASVVFHYTSRDATVEVAVVQELRPGRSGKLYLTDGRFLPGADAARRLAIPPGKVIEYVFAVSMEECEGLSERRRVLPLLGVDGAPTRPGGGWEYWTSRPIALNPAIYWRVIWP